MSAKRILASHPDFQEINELQTMLCLVLNSHVHYNTRALRDGWEAENGEPLPPVIQEPEFEALKTDILSDLAELIDDPLAGSVFQDPDNGLELDLEWEGEKAEPLSPKGEYNRLVEKFDDAHGVDLDNLPELPNTDGK